MIFLFLVFLFLVLCLDFCTHGGEFIIVRWIKYWINFTKEYKYCDEGLSQKQYMAFDSKNNQFVFWQGAGNLSTFQMNWFQRKIYKISVFFYKTDTTFGRKLRKILNFKALQQVILESEDGYSVNEQEQLQLNAACKFVSKYILGKKIKKIIFKRDKFVNFILED